MKLNQRKSNLSKTPETSLGFKLKTATRHIAIKGTGKLTNAFFLATKNELKGKIKARLVSQPFPSAFDNYFIRRNMLTRIKKGINRLITEELVNKGKLKKKPWILTRIKTFKSMNDSTTNFTRKISNTELLDNWEIQKIRQTVQASKDLNENEKNTVLDKMDKLETALGKITKWDAKLKELERYKKMMKRGYYSPEEMRRLEKKIERVRAYLNKANRVRKGQTLGKTLRTKLTKSMTNRVALEALGLRILTETEEDAYKIKTLLDAWIKKNGGTIRETKDYIRYPKKYADVSDKVAYRSAHVLYYLGKKEVPLEVHIRTWQMQKEIDEIDRIRKQKTGHKLWNIKYWLSGSGAQIRKKT